MRSDRARCKSQRRFSGSSIFLNSFQSHQNPLSPSSERRIQKLSGFPFFCPSVLEITFAIPHKAKGRFNGRVSSCSAVVFSVKVPFWFCFMRNCEKNVCFGKTEIIRSFSRIEYTGDMGCGILVTWRNLSEKQRSWNLMTMA